MIETWKDVKDYEYLYQISNLGNVKSLHYSGGKKEKILKFSKDKDGYLQVNLTKNKKHKNYKVHRLVALNFIPNPDNLPQVNHKDENKQNNKVDNLEWCTNKYNNNYGTKNDWNKKSIIKFDLEDNIIEIYDSIQEAIKDLQIKNHAHISECCHHKRKKAYGYKWGFYNEYREKQKSKR
jgi:hypothetical protein